MEDLNGNIISTWKEGLATFEEVESKIQGTSQPSDMDAEIFDISRDIPKLQKVIDSTNDRGELESEIKQLVMKYYWHGFYNGFQCCENRCEESAYIPYKKTK